MSGIILGAGGQPVSQDRDDGNESRRMNVTTFLSLGHLVPWGGAIEVRRLTPPEVQAQFKDKRIDLFVCPDLELMGELLHAQAQATGQLPHGSPQEREAEFCGMLESIVRQMTGCHVRRAQSPKPLTVDRRTFYVQFFIKPSDLVGNIGLGSVWWEIGAKEIYAKPQAQQVTQ